MAKECEGTTFFRQLHCLAQKVDTGVCRLQTDLEEKTKRAENREHSHVTAQNLLQDLRKETQCLKQEGLQFSASFDQKGSLFSQTLTACQEFLSASTLRLRATEDYMEQYGYNKPPEKEIVSVSKKENDKATDSEDEGTEERSTQHTESTDQQSDFPQPASESTPVRDKPCGRQDAALLRTPRLEDAGISAFTMNLIHQLDRQTDDKQDNKHTVDNTHIGMIEMEESVPAIFQNNGLTLTPSLWGHTSEGNQTFIQPYFGKDGHDFDIPFTPIQTYSQKPNLLPKQEIQGETNLDLDSPTVAGVKQSNKTRNFYRITSLNDGKNSPIPPVFMTPGAKQINKTQKTYKKEMMAVTAMDSPVVPQFMTPGVKQINRTLQVKQCEEVKLESIIRSPVPPIFITPGAKQIKTLTQVGEGSSVDHESSLMRNTGDGDGDDQQPARRKVNTELFKDDEPEIPEFTMSLQDLNDLVLSFKRPLNAPLQMPEMLYEHQEKDGILPQANVMPEFTSLSSADMESRAFKPVNSKISRPSTLMNRFGFTKKPDENLPPK